MTHIYLVVGGSAGESREKRDSAMGSISISGNAVK
jgi:hypothetical protein